MDFGQNREIDIFDFTSFFGLDFFNFLPTLHLNFNIFSNFRPLLVWIYLQQFTACVSERVRRTLLFFQIIDVLMFIWCIIFFYIKWTKVTWINNKYNDFFKDWILDTSLWYFCCNQNLLHRLFSPRAKRYFRTFRKIPDVWKRNHIGQSDPVK